MTAAPQLIQRTGVVSFGDASLSVWEEGLIDARRAGGYAGEVVWERAFKADVFKRILQTLNRLGWTCVVPEDYLTQYGASFASDRRACSKGDLKGWLEVSGRTIKFETWQGVNTPTRPDHGGRYEWDKEDCMPYLLWLEMERARRRIRDYLCNVFTGYTFKPQEPVMGLAGVTAEEKAAHDRRTSGHYRANLDRAEISMPSNARARDGGIIEHGARVWSLDAKGRVITGTAYYSLNNRWQIVTGRYGLTYAGTESIFTTCPENPMVRRNGQTRRKRLERELQAAVAAMDFDRAKAIKGVLFPTGPLYAIWSKENNLYFDVMYAGYRAALSDAGKYTRAELKPYLGDALENSRYKAVPII